MKKNESKEQRPFPPDETVEAALTEIIQRKTVEVGAQIEAKPTKKAKKPATKDVCVIFFDDGRTACSARRGAGGACDDWGAWWAKGGYPNMPQVEPKCPAGSKVYP